MNVPNDVREGHFVVVANNGKETKRFVIELCYLNKPEFLVLLELAREEYGFEQEGVLVIPCHPQEVEKVLEEAKNDDDELLYARDHHHRGGRSCFGSSSKLLQGNIVQRKLICMYNVFVSLVKVYRAIPRN